jgi:hypothetical protein
MLSAHEPLNAAFCFSALVYAYLVAGVLVVPAYVLTSSQNLHAPYGNALLGALVGLVPAGLLYIVTTQVFFVVAIVVASAFGGLVFGLIAGRNLTISTEFPVKRTTTLSEGADRGGPRGCGARWR